MLMISEHAAAGLRHSGGPGKLRREAALIATDSGLSELSVFVF